MKLKFIVVLAGLTFCASTFAANSDQAAIDALQKQIASVQTETQSALAAQQAQTQKAISDLQTQMQAQITNLQNEMQQLQTHLDAAKNPEAPVVTATPGETKPAVRVETKP